MTLFTAAFESEDRYVVTDFLVDRSGDSPRGFYLLQPERLLEWLPSGSEG
jgi:hypothetical protein